MTEVIKATAIERRHKMSCDVCMLLDTEATKDIEFHLYEEAYYNGDDKYICSKCLNGIKDVRKKCHQKIDNPKHDIFKDWVPWFAHEIPGLVEAFKKQMS